MGRSQAIAVEIIWGGDGKRILKNMYFVSGIQKTRTEDCEREEEEITVKS